MPSTPVYGFPYLELADPPDIPAATQDLAEAVEAALQTDLAVGGDLAVPGDLTVSGSTHLEAATIDGAINWGGATTVWNTQNAQIQTASATYNVGTTTCGVAFVAPPSGKVLFHFSAELLSTGPVPIMSIHVRTGAVVGSGGDVLVASDDYAVRSITTTAAREQQGRTYPLSGLTAGASYNVVTMQRAGTAAPNAFFERRQVIVQPVI